jgi:flagellar motor switch protein FliN
MVPPPEAAPESTPHGASAEILNQAAKRVADVWGIGLAESAIAATAVDEDPELVCGGLRVGAENFTPVTIVLCPSADFVESLQAQEEGSLAAGLGEERSAALANPFQGPSSNLDLLFDVQLEATIRFGGRQLLLREILSLSPGSAIGLDRQIDEPAELLVAGRLVARGQVVVVDGNFGLRITDVTSARQRSELLHA